MASRTIKRDKMIIKIALLLSGIKLRFAVSNFNAGFCKRLSKYALFEERQNNLQNFML